MGKESTDEGSVNATLWTQIDNLAATAARVPLPAVPSGTPCSSTLGATTPEKQRADTVLLLTRPCSHPLPEAVLDQACSASLDYRLSSTQKNTRQQSVQALDLTCTGELFPVSDEGTPLYPTTANSFVSSLHSDASSVCESASQASAAVTKAHSQVSVHLTRAGADEAAAAVAEGSVDESEDKVTRPDASSSDILEYMNERDLALYLEQHNLTAEPYAEGVAFCIGEGGRELLRAALLHHTDGRALQGASVPQLLKLAHAAELWPLVQRIRAERLAGKLTGLHLAFCNFKAAQSRRRRRTCTVSMHAIRNGEGKILNIIYDPHKTLHIGLEGRSRLKLLITKRMDSNPETAMALLVEHGLQNICLRFATVAELLAIAWVLGLWQFVVEIKQDNEDRKRSLTSQKTMRHRGTRRTGERLDASQGHPGKKGRTQEYLESPETAADAQLNGIFRCDVSAVRCDPHAGKVREAASLQALAPVNGCKGSSFKETNDRPKDIDDVGTVASVTDNQGPADGVAEPVSVLPACEAPQEAPAKPTTQKDLSGTACSSSGPLHRIGQLVSLANPAAPNAKAVAAEIVQELLSLVQRGLLPNPPKAVLQQLQVAASRLGICSTPPFSPQVASYER
ncbi:uncharacterized protein LOC113146557 [Cyclospora cayetanensis]|uniref:Uncharacterized protein LOC113146557 n=1 Tax=Cyclospora cayetanensis TaxID=88456 RepID=A0A6P6RR94_9EIME|nr:uncharacterized protein LOC113146557 [Cyclospora cayetanensis]